MIYDEQSRLQASDSRAEAFLANEAAPELKPITRRPVRLRWTAQGELFKGDE